MYLIFSGCGDTAVWTLRIKIPHEKYEGKKNDVLISFIGYVSD